MDTEFQKREVGVLTPRTTPSSPTEFTLEMYLFNEMIQANVYDYDMFGSRT